MRRTMKRKKRSPEEIRADRERREGRLAELRYHIELIDAELHAKGQEPRGLEYWIERAKAEHKARESPA
jgi:hypothetical protein